MKLLHFSTEKYWRGGEQQIAYLIEEQQKAGFSNYLICRKNSEMERYAIHNKIEFWAIPIKNSIDPRAILKVQKIYRTLKPDLVHLHSSKAHTIGLMADLFAKKQKFILHRRVSFPIQQTAINKWKYNHPQILKIVCISQDVQKAVLKITRNDQKTCVIYSGINLKRFNEKSELNALKKEFNLPQHVKIVTGVGALSPEKDFTTFIKAAHECLRTYEQVHFFIIGNGNEKKELQQLIEQLGIEEKVTLAGFRKDIPSILLDSDIFMLCSTSEGLGTSFIDAAAAKCALLGTATGGIPEIIQSGENGYLAKAGDYKDFTEKLIQLLSNDDLRLEFAKTAKSKAEKFSIQLMAEQYRKLYSEILR